MDLLAMIHGKIHNRLKSVKFKVAEIAALGKVEFLCFTRVDYHQISYCCWYSGQLRRRNKALDMYYRLSMCY
jgi:hypothetical protein